MNHRVYNCCDNINSFGDISITNRVLKDVNFIIYVLISPFYFIETVQYNMVRTYKRKRPLAYNPELLQNLASEFTKAKITKPNQTLREFAQAKGIPLTTAHRWLHQPPRQKRPGHPTVLTEEEENLLATALKFLGDSNMGRDRADIKTMVQELLKATKRPNPFPDSRPGLDWLRRFERRHPDLSQRTPEVLTVAHAKSLTPETVNIFFNKYEGILTQNIVNGLPVDPKRIFNCDETG
jgi:hypothetical protein